MHGLSFHQLAQVQPFHFAVDSRMVVVQEGAALHRVAATATGSPFHRLFRLLEPALAAEPAVIRAHLDSQWQLLAINSGVRLTGRFFHDAGQDLFFFFGAPLADQPVICSNQARLRFLSRVLMTVSDPILIEDLDGKIIEVNDEAVRVYGWPRQELLGQSVKMLLPPGHHAFSDALLESCKAGRDIFNLEGERQSREGKILPALITMTLLRDEQGNPAGVVSIAKDISARKEKESKLEKQRQQLEEQVNLRTAQLQAAIREAEEANAQLQKVQERLTIALDSAQIGIWEFDARSKEETWDERMYEIFGIERATAADPHTEFARGVLPEDLVKLQEEIRMSLLGEIDYDTVYRVRWPDGSLHYIKGSGLVIRDGQGNPSKVIGANYDITELKEYEINLHIAKEAAEAANVAKSDFLARMSHEIRTPMNAVIGMTHLALQTELTAKQRDYLDKAHSSAVFLLGIINDILDFSKIEAGKLELEETDFSLDEVLEQLSNIFAVKAAEKNLELLFHVHPDVPAFLRGDPLRLRQVLINLTGNALKFTPAGEIVVAIRVQALAAERIRLEFSVRDSGIGLTEEQIGKLFASFSQADGSTTRKYGGTGLGLVICKRLVAMMGGEIRVESEYGAGSTFSFTADFAPSPRNLLEEFAVPEWFAGLRALIVDDSDVSRRILSGALESFGITATTVPSGEAALEAIAAAPVDHPFQLVMMDKEMAGMDGIETARRILADAPPGGKTKIIMATAYGQEHVAKEAAAAGIHGFLVKPVSRSALFEAIGESFGLASSRRSGQRSSGGVLPPSLRGARVLLVEDNPINQQVARELLEQAGLLVKVVENGRLGVSEAVQGGYDLILMDIQMPEMDGYTASARIRAQGESMVPILAMTANAMAGDREKSLAAGMNDHLTKPIDPVDLYRALARWIAPGERPLPESERPAADSGGAAPVTLAIPTISGIDTALGLTRVNSNRQLYRQLLRAFVSDHGGDAERAGQCLENNDPATALRLVHTVKGVAGSIGALAVQQSAALLEEALRTGEAEYRQLLADLTERLAGQCAAVEAALKGLDELEGLDGQKGLAASAADQPEGRPAELFSLLSELRPHLARRKPKPAAELVARLQASRWPGECQDDLAELAAQVKKYRFREAEAALDRLLTALSGGG